MLLHSIYNSLFPDHFVRRLSQSYMTPQLGAIWVKTNCILVYNKGSTGLATLQMSNGGVLLALCVQPGRVTHPTTRPHYKLLCWVPYANCRCILGPLQESPSKNRYVLVAMDYFTRWAEAYAIPNQEAITIATKLVDVLFLRFSIPEQLHSDQGRQFESRLMSEICSLLGIRKTRTTPYHPQSDGLVERFNRTLLNMLSICCQDHLSTWENQLPKVCMAYNTSIQHSTGFTPFYLMFGRKARLPVDLMYGSCPDELQTPATYASQLQESLQQSYIKVRENMRTAHNRQKDNYDQHVHGKPLQPGDLV